MDLNLHKNYKSQAMIVPDTATQTQTLPKRAFKTQ